MKKILFFVSAVLATLAVSCGNDDNTWDTYTEWRDLNNSWLAEQQGKTDASGEKFYTTLVAPWNPKGYVLIHYYNDRAETEGNLSPLYNSTVNVRYRGSFYNAVGFDSSDLQTEHGKGIAQFQLNQVIEGWSLAISDMRVGDTAEILIPYAMGYGLSGSGAIPPFTNLQFNVRLVDIPDYEKRP